MIKRLVFLAVLGVALASSQTPEVKKPFIIQGKQYNFVAASPEELAQFELILKINALTVEIAKSEALGVHPYGQLKELKKLVGKVKE